jgi:hypothetical protein
LAAAGFFALAAAAVGFLVGERARLVVVVEVEGLAFLGAEGLGEGVTRPDGFAFFEAEAIDDEDEDDEEEDEDDEP